VFAAYDPDLEREVAIEVFNPPNAAEASQREAIALARNPLFNGRPVVPRGPQRCGLPQLDGGVEPTVYRSSCASSSAPLRCPDDVDLDDVDRAHPRPSRPAGCLNAEERPA
jgi:hypothetical protein